ncbi:MAG: hypothetical protein AAGK04_12740 [Planctomycetota bacterium]
MLCFRLHPAGCAIAVAALAATSAHAQVVAVSNVSVLDSAPNSLAPDTLVGTQGYLFDEQQEHTLGVDLHVEIGQPGIFLPGAPIGATITAGTTVSSSLFHWDLPAGGNGGSVLGSIQIDPDFVILGVIASNESLAATDDILGLDSVLYPTDDPSRRMEIEPDTIGSNGADTIGLSTDRTTLTFQLGLGSQGIDQMRILTAPRVVPAPAGAAALALSSLAATRRRR